MPTALTNPVPTSNAARVPRAPVITSLTSLRGLLAVWVVCYHFWNETLLLLPSLSLFSPLIEYGNFAVPGFFVLSGFVISYNYSYKLSARQITYPQFLFQRLARIYPVHLVTLLIVLAMVMFEHSRGHRLTESGYTARYFTLNLFLLQTWLPHFTLNWNYPSWSISSEWFAYICFPLMVGVIAALSKRLPWARLILLLNVVITLLLYRFGAKLPFRELLTVVPTFFGGCMIYVLLRKEQLAIVTRRLTPEVSTMMMLAVTFFVGGTCRNEVIILWMFVLIYSLASLGDGCSAIWRWLPLQYLGEVSYSLYMGHTLAQKICYVLLPAATYKNSSFPARIGILLIYAGAVFVTTCVLYYAVEYPARISLRRWNSRTGSKLDVPKA